MRQKISVETKKCCETEKEALMKDLKLCDENSESPDDRHQCYRVAASESGNRSRECIGVLLVHRKNDYY